MNQLEPFKKLEYVDALRGLAILGVIMVHCGGANLPGVIGITLGHGARGVQLFYLASAFTLFLSFKSRISKEEFPIRNFFIRRFFRIAPMYYLGICYYLFQDGLGPRYWLGDETSISTLNILSNFLFLHSFNPYWNNSLVPGGWTIGVEMTFYALLPFIFVKIKNINHAFTFFVFSLFLKLILHLIFKTFPLIEYERLWKEYLYLYFPSQLPIFSLGILLYFTIIEQDKLANISGKTILLFGCLVLSQLYTGTQFLIPNHVLFGLGFLVLGLGLSKYHFIPLVNPLIIYIGKISFSMYLVHFAVLHWTSLYSFADYSGNAIVDYISRLLIILILTILISTFFYRIIEVPFQLLGKRIIARLEE